MDYTINERYFERVVEIKTATDDLNEEKAAQYLISITNSEDDIIRGIFAGYLHAMESGAQIANVLLDMTYETLPNIIPATTALAYLQKKQGYDNQENAELTMKTLAAYLTLMAVNNHRAKIQVNKRASRRREEAPDLWSYIYYLRINNKRDSDFLPPAIEGINATPVEVANGFTVDVGPLIGAYKRITGVDLEDYGFSNLIIDFDDELSVEITEPGDDKNENERRYSLNSLTRLIKGIEDKINDGESISRLDEQLLSIATVVRDFLVSSKAHNINLDLTVETEQDLNKALMVHGVIRSEEGIGEQYIIQEAANIAASYQLFELINMLDSFGLAADAVLNEDHTRLIISTGWKDKETRTTFDTFEAMERVKDTCFRFKTVHPYNMGFNDAEPDETTRSFGVSLHSFREIVENEFLMSIPEEE